MEDKVKFSLEEVDKTFTKYSTGKPFDGVVVLKRPDGVIFNIGGKHDAFIEKDDFDNFDSIKVGERFKVLVLSKKNEEGLVLASRRGAEELIFENQSAEKLKLGSVFSFVVTDVQGGLMSRMGNYNIFIPAAEVSEKYVADLKNFIGKRKEAVVIEIDRDNRSVIGSIKLIESQARITVETNFWNSIFVNKVVKGKVVKFAAYGAFVNVNGIDCLAHISDLSYSKIGGPEEVLNLGGEYSFKVLKVDRESKRVSLGFKQLQDDPMTLKIRELKIGEEYEGEVIKILPFGAVFKLESGVSGLLHISEVTDNKNQNIYEFVKLGDRRLLIVISADSESRKVSFRLAKDRR